ncbi:T9SS type A sorting domain-containing protein [bacterium]|nr:T9SS type A sorting domain-containing protein [bacterium]
MKKDGKVLPLGGVAFILCVVTTLTLAQPPDTLWTKTYGGINDDAASSVQQTSDDGYIIAGWTESFGAGGSDVYLIKTDAGGNTLWTKTYGDTDGDVAESVEQTFDGGYIVAGISMSFGAGNGDYYLIKTDASGDSLWAKTYGGLDIDWGFSVDQTADSGYIVAGISMSYGGAMDAYLVKTDTGGITIWDTTYGGILHDGAFSVQQTSDSGYIVAGVTLSFGAGMGDVYLIKTDAGGDTLWTKTFGDIYDDIAMSVQQTSDDGYIIAGATFPSWPGESDVYLIKTDSQGDILWTRTYGGIGEDAANSVQQTLDGSYIVAGYTASFSVGGYDVWLIKTNMNGDTLWTETYGGLYDDAASSVQQTSDGGYIIAGYTESIGAGGSDVWLIKTEPDVGIEEHKPAQTIFSILQIYPNPFRNVTDIRYEITNNSKIELDIYDISGRLVMSFSSLSSVIGHLSSVEWDGTDDSNRKLPSGVYFLKFQSGDYSATEKLLLIR